MAPGSALLPFFTGTSLFAVERFCTTTGPWTQPWHRHPCPMRNRLRSITRRPQRIGASGGVAIAGWDFPQDPGTSSSLRATIAQKRFFFGIGANAVRNHPVAGFLETKLAQNLELWWVIHSFFCLFLKKRGFDRDFPFFFQKILMTSPKFTEPKGIVRPSWLHCVERIGATSRDRQSHPMRGPRSHQKLDGHPRAGPQNDDNGTPPTETGRTRAFLRSKRHEKRDGSPVVSRPSGSGP